MPQANDEPTTDLMILNTKIRRDAEGRYCLNDCHKAAEGEATKRPGLWLANRQTTELVAELETAGIPAVKTVEGRNGGTYAVKELVYAYAMWINPKFHLKVIRAFDAMATGQLPTAFPLDQFAPDELNAKIGASRHAMRLWGKAAGRWAWAAAGLPLPPRHLLPGWIHPELLLLEDVAA